MRRSHRTLPRAPLLAKSRPAKAKRQVVMPPAGLTLLEGNSVAPRTRSDYEIRVSDFLAFMVALGLSFSNAQTLVEGLLAYFEQLFWEDRAAAEGDKLVAALRFHWPWFAQDPVPSRVTRALKGWHRLMPSAPRLPLPWAAICGWAAACVALGRADMGLAMLLAADAYLRPGEVMVIRVGSLHQPVAHATGTMGVWCLTIFDFETGRSSKTGHFNDSIVLDSIGRSGLGLLLSRLAAGRDAAEPLFKFSYLEWAAVAKRAAAAALLAPLAPVLYQLRHSGPSVDIAEGRRSLAQVKVRGRWVSDNSVRRYEKHSQLAKQWAMLSPAAQSFAQTSETQIWNVVAGLQVLPLPRG